jgi:hypothetical protein
MKNHFSRRHVLLPVSTLATLTALLLSPTTVLAQDKDKKENDVASANSNLAVSTVYVGDNETFYIGNKDNSDLKKKVSLEADNMPITEAIKKVVEQAGLTCEIDADVPTDKTISTTMKNVPLSVVLGYLTSEAEVGWTYMHKVQGDKQESTIKIGKHVAHKMFTYTLPPETPFPPNANYDNKQFQEQMKEAMKVAQNAARLSSIYTPRTISISRLPDTRVKLDVRNSNIRDALKDVLKQAELDYALEDDVPDDLKRSFTFENVPIATALDVICRSAEIGWTVQRTASREVSKAGETDKKPKVVILIGKKYARGSMSLYGMDAVDPTVLTTPVLEGVAPLVDPRLSLPEPDKTPFILNDSDNN